MDKVEDVQLDCCHSIPLRDGVNDLLSTHCDNTQCVELHHMHSVMLKLGLLLKFASKNSHHEFTPS